MKKLKELSATEWIIAIAILLIIVVPVIVVILTLLGMTGVFGIFVWGITQCSICPIVLL